MSTANVLIWGILAGMFIHLIGDVGGFNAFGVVLICLLFRTMFIMLRD